jgi:hypothetical protein
MSSGRDAGTRGPAKPVVWPRWLLVAAGLAPIGALCGALVGIVPLHRSAPFAVLPVVLAGIAVAARYPAWGRVALAGLGAGALATAIYDVLRFGLIAVGVFGDFIPEIGVLLGATDQAALWGYVWRYLGNGGGMGVAFAMLPWRGPWPGALYGTAICCCLFATVGLFPDAADKLFVLSAPTMAGALAGHWVYGASLGALTRRHPPPSAACAR